MKIINKNLFPHKVKFINVVKSSTLFISTFILVSSCAAQVVTQTPAKSLIALSKNDHTLAIVDPVSLKVIARIPVGEDPHEVVASTDGKTAYVSIYGGGSLHELNVIDLIAQKPLVNVDTRPLFGPHGLAFANGKAWFTAEGSKSIGRYDPATGKLDWSMGTGQDRTHMIYVSENGKKIYTTNVSSGTVTILSDTLVQPGQFGPPPGSKPSGQPGTPQGAKPPGQPGPPPNSKPHEEWREKIIPTANGSEGFDVSPDKKELWTAASEDGTITIINLVTEKQDTRIDAKLYGANRLKFTPDGKRVFISSLRDGQLFIYDAKTHKELKRVNIGHGAAGILMDPNGTRAFVACTGDDYIAVIDLKTLEVISKVDVGGGPDGMEWAIQKQ